MARDFSIKVSFAASKVAVDNNREHRLHRVQDGSPRRRSKMESTMEFPDAPTSPTAAGACRSRPTPEPHWGRAGLITTQPHTPAFSALHCSLLTRRREWDREVPAAILEVPVTQSREGSLQWRFGMSSWHPCPPQETSKVNYSSRQTQKRRICGASCSLWPLLAVIQHKAGGVRRLFSRV